MIVAAITALLSSVLSSCVLLSLSLFPRLLLLSSIVHTLEVQGPDVASDLIRVVAAHSAPSGGAQPVPYTFSPPSTSLSSPYPSTSIPTPAISTPLLNPQTAQVTIMPLTPPFSSTPRPHHLNNFSAPHNASLAGQVSRTLRRDGLAALQDKSLFRPHLLLVALSPQVPDSSRLVPCSKHHHRDHHVLHSSSPQEDVNLSEASGEVRNQIRGTDSRDIVQAKQSHTSEAESLNQVSTTGKTTRGNVKLIPDDGSDDSRISQTNQTAGHVQRKTRRSLTSTSRKTRVNHPSLRKEVSSAAMQANNQKRTAKQSINQSTLRDARKIESQGNPRESMTLPTLLPSPLGKGSRIRSDVPGPHRDASPTRGAGRPLIRIHLGRKVKMLLSKEEPRGGSSSHSGRRRQKVLSSPTDLEEREDQLDEEKNYGATKQEGERDESFRSAAEGRVIKGSEEQPRESDEEGKSGRQHENPNDTSFHALHVSPFIPDLTLNAEDTLANPSLHHPSVSPSRGVAAPFPTPSHDNPSANHDTRTPAPQAFIPPARPLGINEHLHKGDKIKEGRGRQAGDPSPMTDRVKLETKRGMDQPLPLYAGEEVEHSDSAPVIQNEAPLQFYETNTNKAGDAQDQGQLPLLLPPSPDEEKAGSGGRKVPPGPTSKKGTSQAPDVPLLDTEGSVRIPCYVIIFLLGMIGNTLVIVTLLQNRKMRTITNVFLLNLAFSDLLLGVFCMPFTLIGSLLRDFIFGAVMCRLIPYFQAVSVSVSVWTLVAISLERFYAICQPLKSRGWQTLSHAYKIISLVWLLSLVFMAPIAVLSQLLPVGNTSRHKCREMWPSLHFERGFSMFLCAALLLVPLVIMVAAYSSITVSLWHGMRLERETGQGTEPLISLTDLNGLAMVQQSLRRKQFRRHVSKISIRFRKIPAQTKQCVHCGRPEGESSLAHTASPSQGGHHPHACLHERDCENYKWRVESVRENSEEGRRRAAAAEPSDPLRPPSFLSQCSRRPTKPDFKRLRSTHLEKSIEAKKHVIRMLFVVVLEFFVCWTPIFVVNIMCLYIPEQVYRTLGFVGISFMHLLSYASSCCNPITYCFMNKKFLQGFRYAFGCRKEAERNARKNGTAASFRSQSNNIFKLTTEVKRDARETTV